MNTHTTLKHHARTLALSGLLQSLDMRLQEAQSHNLPHAHFLELILQDEIHIRQQRQILRRTKAATFRSPSCPATIKNGFRRQLEMTPDDN